MKKIATEKAPREQKEAAEAMAKAQQSLNAQMSLIQANISIMKQHQEAWKGMQDRWDIFNKWLSSQKQPSR